MKEQEWLNQLRERNYPWMNDDQWECLRLLHTLVGGDHHLCGKVHPAGPNGIRFNKTNGGLATYDFNNLTQLVLLAHDRCIRAEICPSGPGMVGIMLHKRQREGDRMYQRHPTIEQAIESYRKAS